MKRLSGIVICIGLAVTGAGASATNLVTGNGFGFAVVNPQKATITSFYAHPYSFERADPKDALSEGIPTANFLKSVSWGGAAGANASAEYEDDSQVIRINSKAGEGLVFMPFGLKRAVVVISWEPARNGRGDKAWNVEWSQAVKSSDAVRMGGVEMQLLAFKDVPERLLLIPLEPQRGIAAGARELLGGSSSYALVSVRSDGDAEEAAREFVAWRKGLSAQQLARREMSELEQWRVKPAFSFASEKARHLWRQSEVMLRMAQCREPNTGDFHGNGLIVAALPDGAWFTPWVRDMAWATVALAKMGHREEARAAVLAYFQAQPTGKMRAETSGADYQISVVRYFGNGAEEPFFTNEGSTNIEYDDWGEALWGLGEYLRKYGDDALLKTATHRGELYASARDFIVKPLEANMEPYGGGLIMKADTSIWEEREKDKKHFAFSTAMAIVGLREFSEIAERMGDEPAKADALRHVAELQKGFDAAFIRDGKLHGTLEEGVKNDIDGALLTIIHFGVVKDPAIIRSTVDRMELLKVKSGGYRRVRSTYTDPKIYEYWYEREEFLFVDFSLAEVERQMGRKAEADAMVKRIVDKVAEDHNIIPEMYVALDCELFHGAIGDPTGAKPMVGYGAGEYVLDVLDSGGKADR